MPPATFAPGTVITKWREALDYFFHIDARIISTRHRREMERELPAGANPWEHYRYLITSVDYAKQPAIKNQILEQRVDRHASSQASPQFAGGAALLPA